MEYRRSLFVFRRDLRLEDNDALVAALDSSKEVVCLFNFDPRQVGENNRYFSISSFQFLLEALEDLGERLKSKKGKLYFTSGIAADQIAQVIHKNKIDALFLNRDYTPFAIKRDQEIKKCIEIPIHFYDTLMLNPPGKVLKGDGAPYTIFTPYYKAGQKFSVPKPNPNRRQNYFSGSLKGSITSPFHPEKETSLIVRGKRDDALKILKKNYKGYSTLRDLPAENGTTHLSAFMKFSLVSPKEAYHLIKENTTSPEPLLRQLYWRDFFTQIAAFFPHVFGKSFRPEFDAVPWEKGEVKFQKWCAGETGFPIVDAGMRELNETGYMHNRLRMITASFLTKDLQLDWRLGERYFAQKLTDYDPCVNNGSWQWAASTGCDAQPYFRIFNPWLQQKKFDPECQYIKKWVPELSGMSPKEIHGWEKEGKNSLYPQPICDHSVESAKAKERFKWNIKK
jgi:deoxyribodipyrimidine photo-lyase